MFEPGEMFKYVIQSIGIAKYEIFRHKILLQDG